MLQREFRFHLIHPQRLSRKEPPSAGQAFTSHNSNIEQYCMCNRWNRGIRWNWRHDHFKSYLALSGRCSRTYPCVIAPTSIGGVDNHRKYSTTMPDTYLNYMTTEPAKSHTLFRFLLCELKQFRVDIPVDFSRLKRRSKSWKSLHVDNQSNLKKPDELRDRPGKRDTDRLDGGDSGN